MSLIGICRNLRCAAPLLIFLTAPGCSHNQELRNIQNVHDYQSFMFRHGDVPSCGFSKEAITFFPGMGGDSVTLTRGKPINIYDVGDTESGPTLESHDRIIIRSAKPEQIEFSRKGSSLIICSEERSISAAIIRQYCGQPNSERPWNNSIEEITFASGETWLSDDLFRAYQEQGNYVTKQLLESYKIADLSDEEIRRWRVRPLSEMIPPQGKARQYCRAERRTFIDFGYDPDAKRPLQNFGPKD